LLIAFIHTMDENPYQSPEGQPDRKSGVPLAMPSTAARVGSMILICLGAAFATLAVVIVTELIRLKISGNISIFEEPPVPTWMALICTSLATSLIGLGIFIRRRSSRKRMRALERR
jgi:hypothetical protein